ncbi:hypothetical protein Ait01nite_069920 [Actinoplanes italicus]|uniref:Uncharacterized protein n=1 Tax=Actinoplanes italicus TaxID=113567 RepID=A0A2T0JYG6_9ACTN|nr:hypothetical protein [Actinoplanes italicus]PRX13306.1 hypothetical protein CLV67_12515 [Actinoplanes italicus]GIE33947.1 hypothetical protein Ait01nite_069920 [Actinoplanes italicus]
MSILLDAGPSLNFLAVDQQNILIQVAASQSLQLAAPARVDGEIIGMSFNERFKTTNVRRVWTTLKTSGRVAILPDELTTREFTAAVTRISGMPARDRVRTKKSLGEIMVLAHASVYVQQGHDVFVLIDDRDGRQRASREARWLGERGHKNRLDLWSTRRVLQEAGRNQGWITGELTWEQVYDQMTAYDDGLIPRSQWRPRR